MTDWLLNSGIQNTAGPEAGGFNGWYDADRDNYPFIYSEITGYGITTLLFANSIKPNPLLLKRAAAAADWISNRAMHPCGGVRARLYYDDPENAYSFENNVIITFDTGMALAGIVNMLKTTNDASRLEAASLMGKFLVSLQRKDGSFFAAFDANNRALIDNQEKWSSQAGSYHAKLAIGLLDLYEASGNKMFQRAAISACNYAVRQQDNGRFVTQQDENSTHMHPHCYSAEGLAYASAATGNNAFMKAAADAVAWTLDNQLENGGVPCKFVNDVFVEHERSDTLAQTLRLAAFMHANGFLGGYERHMEKLSARLLQFQKTSGKHSGGFIYGTELDGTPRNHVNSWCSMFALQALRMHDNFKGGSQVALSMLI